MQKEWIGANQWCGAIALEVFGRVGLGVGELQNFELVDVEEKHRWSDDGINLSLQDLVHNFQFAYVSLEVWHVGRSCGQVFGQLNIL